MEILGRIFMKKRSDNDKAVLLEQQYGREEYWEKHFEYLKPFFNDSRYIKIDNKPIFLYHAPDEIPCLYEMIEYINSKAQKIGFSGVHSVGGLTNHLTSGMDALGLDRFHSNMMDLG